MISVGASILKADSIVTTSDAHFKGLEKTVLI